MDFYGKYKSPFGYQTGTNGIDSYGVDHKGFDTRDELEYQTARNTKERRLANDLQRQRIGENDYPQYGTDFWGNSENNYGFGVRNIGQNAQNHPAMNMTPVQNQQSKIKYSPLQQIVGAVQDMTRNYFDMKRDNTVGADDYFHCKANYEAAKRGNWGKLTAKIMGDEKEVFDYFKNRYYKGIQFPDALADYWHDKDVNSYGRALVDDPRYTSSVGACSYKRVKGINEKY